MAKISPFRPVAVAKKRRKKKVKLEKTTERGATKIMREDGATVAKLNLMGQKSWPDRLIFPPGVRIPIFTCDTEAEALRCYEIMKKRKKVFMIEYKREGEELTVLQAELQTKIGEPVWQVKRKTA